MIKDGKELEHVLATKLLTELQSMSDRNAPLPEESWLRDRLGVYLEDLSVFLPPSLISKAVDRVVFRLVGYGPLEALLRDHDISEIMVNGKDHIYVEKSGRIQRHTAQFTSEEELLHIINRIVGRVGRRIDESSPLVDARLSDGSRVNAIIPPLSLVGPVLTIRKFPAKSLDLSFLLSKNTLTSEMAEFLRLCVLSKQNIIISGGTGSGKTSTLNTLCSTIPHHERLITIEDAAEIRIDHPHLISLESRPANLEGKGEIPIRVLLKNALRMRPDRIIVGEVRSGEALDMLQAMNTGHKGSLTTVHANSPLECLYRIETMALMSDVGLPLGAIRSQVNEAIDVIVQQERMYTGERVITYISEVRSHHQDEYEVADLFRYDLASKTFERTKHVPQFFPELQLMKPDLKRTLC